MRRTYDATGVSMEGNFTIAPEGVYDLVILKVTDIKDGLPWKTKNGDDYVSVETEIASGEFANTKVWHGVTVMEDKTRKGAGMALQFLKAIGEPYEGKFEIDTDRWVGKRFRAKLKIAKDNQGRAKNEIAYVITEGTGDDEVPF